MRAMHLTLLTVLLASGSAFAQESPTNHPPSTSHFEYGLSGSRNGAEFTAPTSEKVLVGKHVQVEGLLAQPLKAKKAWDIPRKLLQMLNPFSKQPESESGGELRMVGTRAWSTTVGWSPGQSAFPDEMRHEPQMRLLTASVAK